ncbi:beta-aspartyl-peptidase [Thalassotalea euphylliae]|uniref:beta-aspartyl-peptidase n=1 Tax=Thalassotalea euphylliae TaxID=1655234 RepID=UPI00362FA72D
MKLFKQAEVYSPQYLGTKDVLIAGTKILKIADELTSFYRDDIEVIDCQGKILCPGFVDSLVHITGGGGEGGYSTRTPEMSIEEAIVGGVTTLVGVLGTDSITRSLENLLAKSYALEEQGLNVYCHTGSYHLPAVNITGSVTKDIMLIDKFIGVGEVAIADHRGSQLTVNELAKVASEARVGGMLANKSGIVSIHVGDSEEGVSLIQQVAEETDIPVTQFYPTHMNRSAELLEQGISLAKAGGYIDFTTSTNEQILASGEVSAAHAMAIALDKGVPVSQITMSSDGNASLPLFDDAGKLVDLQVGKVASLHESVVEAILEHNVSIAEAIASVTQSPADILNLKKGRIVEGVDADLNVLRADSFAVEDVYSKGAELMKAGKVVITSHF